MKEGGARRDLTEGVIVSPLGRENAVFPPKGPVTLLAVATEAGSLVSLFHLHFNLNTSLSLVNGSLKLYNFK